MPVKRSSSESEASVESPTKEADEVEALLTSTNSHEAKTKEAKKFLQRCKSNPERSWRKQNMYRNERILKLGTEKEQTLQLQPITDQPPKLSYFCYQGNTVARFSRYHSVSTDADVVINLGYDIAAINRPQAITGREMHRYTSIADNEPIKMQQGVDCFTCMCCVKALFYHGTKDCPLERDWGDEPCSCEVPGKECVVRWGILGMLSVFMPCLVCYPICKGCWLKILFCCIVLEKNSFLFAIITVVSNNIKLFDVCSHVFSADVVISVCKYVYAGT